MAKRPRQSKLIKLDDVLQSVLKGRNITITSEKKHLQKIWSQVVGSQIAGQTSPDRLKNNTLFVQAGAGIVADSVPESEWLETQNKARAVLRAAEMVLDGLDAKVHR